MLIKAKEKYLSRPERFLPDRIYMASLVVVAEHYTKYRGPVAQKLDLYDLVDPCIKIHEAAQLYGDEAAQSLARLLLFQLGVEIAKLGNVDPWDPETGEIKIFTD